LLKRHKEFDDRYEALEAAGLRLPPSYNDIDFSDNERLADLEERPDFPVTIEPSRPYKDIELPHSAGVIPASVAQYLRDYQVDGVAFLHELFVYQTVPWPGPTNSINPHVNPVRNSPNGAHASTNMAPNVNPPPVAPQAKQGPGNSQAPPNPQKQAATHTAPPKKSRRRPGNEYLIAARQRREHGRNAPLVMRERRREWEQEGVCKSSDRP
jgi:hypothetical protein